MMAILNLDLLNSDQTINSDNADDTNTVNIVALGTHTLTVDGVSATVSGLAGVQAASSPTFSAINDGNLTIDYGALGANTLSGVTYNVGDTSNISVQGPSILGVNLGTQTVNFSGNGAGSFTYDKGLIDSVSSFNVNGFDWGDSVGVDGYEFDSFDYDSVSGSATLVLTNGALIGEQTVTFNMTGVDPELAAAILADPASFVDSTGQFVAPVCFLRGTMIDTDRGEVAVEDIRIGDQVLCRSGLRTVQWVGHRHDWVDRIPQAHLDDMWPILIEADAISEAVPSKDIRVSPWHHLYVDGVLVRARDLVNGSTIRPDKSLKRISYYHIELDQFDVIHAHGIYSESYTDGGNRDFFHNAAVTRMTMQPQPRREGIRPGFHAVRDAKTISAMQRRFAERAALIADQAHRARRVA
ncbi:Hint domain-containing protein [Sphingobium lactosutens]|nr:Hint domain-containing protein [Sphingobium lactosutens]